MLARSARTMATRPMVSSGYNEMTLTTKSKDPKRPSNDSNCEFPLLLFYLSLSLIPKVNAKVAQRRMMSGQTPEAAYG